MQDSRVLKQIVPDKCPYCGKEIMISTNIVLPSIVGIFTKDDLKKAKEKIKEGLAGIQWSSEKEKEDIFTQLDNPSNLLDASDVESIISQISKDQVNKISEQNKEKK
jgi:hypothetical protein